MFWGETGLDEGASVYADWRQPTFRIPPTSRIWRKDWLLATQALTDGLLKNVVFSRYERHLLLHIIHHQGCATFKVGFQP